ncbi:uncharacterized protein LOC141850949 [Brevipalpus obovatus]|uniref:uncharacterized protein LOC141850949 n=1 Tax=Brevipalpus obovatus TaxID=246614 RepID=UPI003D9FAC83
MRSHHSESSLNLIRLSLYYLSVCVWCLSVINCQSIGFGFLSSPSSSSSSSSKITCNQTLTGQRGTRYPLYLKEPKEKYHPYNCRIKFSAQKGDIVELTFLSFKVGYFAFTGKTPKCEYGYVKIHETNVNPDILTTNTGNRGRSTLYSPSNFDGANASYSHEYGNFCGQFMSRKAVYYSESNSLYLSVFLPEGRGFFAQYLPLNVYLTYRFLDSQSVKQQTLPNISPSSSLVTPSRIPGSVCDLLYDDCLPPRRCRLQSPNYPGFYPRNQTCHFIIRQTKRLPKGYLAKISISQTNEYKISIFSGSSTASNGKQVKKGLSFDCNLDYISIFDGPTTESNRLLQFCGSGHLPPLTSTRDQMLVVLHSSVNNVLSDSRFEFDIKIELTNDNGGSSSSSSSSNVKNAILPSSSKSICDFLYTSQQARRGLITSSRQTISSNSDITCNYRFVSDNRHDKVWIQFISYFVEDLNPWSNEEKCDSSKLEIYEPPSLSTSSSSSSSSPAPASSSSSSSPTLSTLSSHFSTSPASHVNPDNNSNNNNISRIAIVNSQYALSERFCEKSSPKICGRIQNATSLPNIPCSYPKESYLSKSSSLLIAHNHRQMSGLYSMPAHFSAIYEFVETLETGDPIIGTLCDRRFVSSKYPIGMVRSSRNVFYYGRGGNQNVSCSYYFHAKHGERLQITIHSLKLKSNRCTQHFSRLQNTYRCRSQSITTESTKSDNNNNNNTDYYSDNNSSSASNARRRSQGRISPSSSYYSHLSSLQFSSSPITASSSFSQSSPSSPSSSSSSSSILSTLLVFDSVSNELFNVACFCDSQSLDFKRKPIVLNLIGTDSVLNFTVTGMSPFHDFDDFEFEGIFKFIDDNQCSSNRIETKSDNQGEIMYTVPSNMNHEPRGYANSNHGSSTGERDNTGNNYLSSSNEFKCRWMFVWYPSKYLSIKFNGYKPDRTNGCRTKNRYIIYWGSPWKPQVTICANSDPQSRATETLHLSSSMIAASQSGERSNANGDSSSSWFASRLTQTDLHPSRTISFFNHTSSKIIVEIIGTDNTTFTFRWLTIKNNPRHVAETSETMRNTDCRHKCPELNVCIHPDLLCDGIKHCPSGYDESNQFCRSSTLWWTVAVSMILLLGVLFLISYSLIMMIRRRKKRTRSVHDVNDVHGTSGLVTLSSSLGLPIDSTLLDSRNCSTIDVSTIGANMDYYGRLHGLRYDTRSGVDTFQPVQEFEFRMNHSFDINNCNSPERDGRIYFQPHHSQPSRRYNNDCNISNDDSFLYFS